MNKLIWISIIGLFLLIPFSSSDFIIRASEDLALPNDPDLLAHWKLGDRLDSSGNGNTLSYTGDTYLYGGHHSVFGKFGKCFKTGIKSPASYLQLYRNGEQFETKNFTFSYWTDKNIRVGNGFGITTICDSTAAGRNGWFFYGNSPFHYCYDDTLRHVISIAGGNQPVVGQWNHIVFTFSYPGNWTYYLNGEFKQTSIARNMTYRSNGATRITLGCQYDGGNCKQDTKIDEVRFYNRSLNINEVLQLYNSTMRSYKFLLYSGSDFLIRG